MLKNAEVALSNVDTTLSTVGGTLTDVEGKLSTVDTTLAETREVLGQVQTLLESLDSKLVLLDEVPELKEKLDAVLVPIGGGGLAAGVSAAVKLWQPDCVVYGIEPVGANVMALSRQAGEPQKIGAMQSIADSLMAPHTDEFSFRVCQDNIDTLVTVNDCHHLYDPVLP